VIQGLLSTQPITQLLFGRQCTFFCPSARPVHGSARPAGNERWCAKDRTVRKLPISQSRGRSKEAHPLLPSAASPAFWTLREGSAGRGGSWMLWRARPQRHGGRHATNRSRRRFEIFGGDYYGECSAISGAVSACVRQLVFAALFLGSDPAASPKAAHGLVQASTPPSVSGCTWNITRSRQILCRSPVIY